MSRPRSDFISRFIHHVDCGLIIGREGSSGQGVVGSMKAALQDILDGAKPDDALAIKRKPGSDRDPYALPLALAIHGARSRKEKWSVIEILANEWLVKNDQPKLSQSRLKQIYKDQLPAVQRVLSVDSMLKKLAIKR